MILCQKPTAKNPDKSHQTITCLVKKPPRTNAPRNEMPPIKKPLQQNLTPSTIRALLQNVGVSVLVATTYTRTQKHSKDVTNRIKQNSRANHGFYLIHI